MNYKSPCTVPVYHMVPYRDFLTTGRWYEVPKSLRRMAQIIKGNCCFAAKTRSVKCRLKRFTMSDYSLSFFMCSEIVIGKPEGEMSIVALDELVSVTLSPRGLTKPFEIRKS